MKCNSKMAENRGVRFKIENKLNKHAAEQSEKLADLKELQSRMQFYKNYYIRLNLKMLKKLLPTLSGLLVSSFSTKLPENQVYKFKQVELLLLSF